MARRHADDEPFCLACRDVCEDPRDKLEVLVLAELAALVQHRESLHREGQEFGLHQFLGSNIHDCLLLGRIDGGCSLAATFGLMPGEGMNDLVILRRLLLLFAIIVEGAGAE